MSLSIITLQNLNSIPISRYNMTRYLIYFYTKLYTYAVSFRKYRKQFFQLSQFTKENNDIINIKCISNLNIPNGINSYQMCTPYCLCFIGDLTTCRFGKHSGELPVLLSLPPYVIFSTIVLSFSCLNQ